MSRMDRMLNSKKDKQTIYEIYRACRLCGAGAGYKMPIIQNVVDLDDTDIELKQKIRECVQIEVHQGDKMPPLICELCVDKVNDFYEFLEMCRQTNKRTRLRLGLPPQSLPGGAPDAGDCILGLTEPVYVNEDSDREPLSKNKKPNQNKSNVKIKKEPQVKVEPRSSRQSKRDPTPPRMLRNSRNSREDSSQKSQERSSKSSPKVSPKAAPKSILKKAEDTSLLSPRLKRTRDKEPVKIETPVKKVKIAIKPVSPPSKPKPKQKSSPPRTYKCDVCGGCNKTPQGLAQHVRTHVVTFTSARLACNPCGEWFSTAEQAASHHRQHRGKARPYHCTRCEQTFTKLADYDEHIANACEPWPEVPDVKCESCWHLFATNNLLESHRCLGQDHRPGGKCSKCNRSYALLRNLKKHESTCTAKKKGTIDPALLAKVKPLQVRVSRCDPLLLNVKQEHYDVSSVAADFGLDKNCVYPYISSFSDLRIKSELPTFKGMVAINEEIKDEFCAKEYIHWDSEDSDSDSDISLLPLNKKVDSLSILTLKTLFSRKCLGRVPRKKRRVKVENFDSILDTEDDVTRDINNIIDNLDNDDDLDDIDIDRSDVNDSRKDSRGQNDSRKDSGDQNDSSVSEVGDDSKLSNDTIDKNDESTKINSLDNEISLDNHTINTSDDKIGNEDKSKKDDADIKNSESGGSNKIDELQSDEILNSDDGKVNDKMSGENNNENDVNAKIDDNSQESKDIISDDSLKTKDTSDDHHINDDKNNEDHANNDENSGNHQKIDEKSEHHQTNDENGEGHQIDDENSNDRKNNDDITDNHQIDDEKENKVNDDDKNDAQNANQINDDITNDLQNNDFSKDLKDNLDDNDLKTNLDSTDSISKEKTNDDSQENVDDNDLVSKVDLNDCRDNENDDEVIKNKEISEEQVTDPKNYENVLLGELNCQESNSLTFNDDLLNDELKNECVNEEDKTKMAVNEDFGQEPKLSAKSDEHQKFNGDNDFNKTLDNNKLKNDEIDDSKLMAALDAQIGESENSVVPEKPESYGFNDKIAIEDIITDKSTEKPIEMDLLPEEFNFD